MNLFDHIKGLADAQLYEDVKLLTSLSLTLSEHNPEMLTVPVKYHMLVLLADSCYQEGNYKKAENVYRKSLQVKKMMNKTKGKLSIPEVPSEVDVKFKLYLCHYQMKQYREAIAVLESISTKMRNSKINLALAKLYLRIGMDRSAVTSFKEVLRESPLSMVSAHGLLALGVKGAEVESHMKNSLPHTANTSLDWLFSWLRGHSMTAAKEYQSAAQIYTSLEVKPLLKDNADLLFNLGEAQFLNGEYHRAETTLQRAHALDPLALNKMDILSYLLSRDKDVKELESLATELMQVCETAPEAWVAMGYYSMVTRKGTRAVYFAQKALNYDCRSVEALLLKGSSLLDLKKTGEAIMHFREAIRIAPYRFEAHRGLVDCYSAAHRNREAIACAGQACKQVTSARSVTLYASVLAKEPFTLEKAKGYLEKALKLDNNYLEAVYIMAEILQQQQQYEKAIELLRDQLSKHSTCRLHQMLADMLMHNNDSQGALDQYSIALSMDPTNQKAQEGLERVEKHGEMGVDSSYDVEVEDMEGTDNEADLEGSDIESAWSDIDLS